jgi:SAM-dependent methyltransferase
MTDQGDVRYRQGFDPETSSGSAVRLIEAAKLEPGVVLDIGCGFGAIAEPLTSLGHHYVGVDVDERALAELRDRGHEAHRCDLLAAEQELADRLRGIVGERRVSAILALDVLEHLLDIPATLRALVSVAQPSDARLVVSFPNVTHYDIGAKLLMGRWDTTDEGLLDRTHAQFLSGRDLVRVFGEAGWLQVDADDVVRPVSDQCFPSYTPVLRPGTPAHDLLRAWRDAADPYGSTFQFVRLFRLGHPPARAERTDIDERRPFATVVLVGRQDADDPGVDALRRDLDANADLDHEIRVVVAPDQRSRVALINEALREARGRYVVVLESGQRVPPGWLRALAAVEQVAVGAILRSRVRVYDETDATNGVGSYDQLAAGAEEITAGTLDLLHVDEPAPVVPAGYAVPAEVVQTAGLLIEPRHGESALAVFLARAAALCGVQVAGMTEVLVPSRQLPDPILDDERVTDALAESPMLLRVGDAARLADLRRRVLSVEERLVALRSQLAARDQQLQTLSGHLGELGARLQAAEAERDIWRRAAEHRIGVWIGVRIGVLARRLFDRLGPEGPPAP